MVLCLPKIVMPTSLMQLKRIMFIFTHHHHEYEYVGIDGVEAAPLGTGQMHMIIYSNAEYKSALLVTATLLNRT